MSLKTQIAAIKAQYAGMITAAKAYVAQLEHDLEHGVMDATYLDGFNAMTALTSGFSDAIDALAYPTITLTSVEYVVTLPEVNYNGAVITAEQIVGDAVLAQALVTAGAAFIVPNVKANFTGTPRTGAHPRSVTFTDTSTNGPTEWLWDFGDGEESAVQNPVHSYVSAGTYTVALTVTNKYGSNTKTTVGYVVIS